jgi:GNAT superfamily N-acetyltransferase
MERARARARTSQPPVILSTIYGFVRGRQLEGTFPGDRATGVWPSTGKRVGYGWGALPDAAWPHRTTDAWPPTEPPNVDKIAKSYRNTFYKRVRTLDDCVAELTLLTTVGISLDISNKWANPPQGKIPSFGPRDIVVSTHLVSVEHYDEPNRIFVFRNWWGPKWGDRGFGYIARKDLEATWWEGWTHFPEPEPGSQSLRPLPAADDATNFGSGIRQKLWILKDRNGSIRQWYELTDSVNDERLAWASTVEFESTLEIEELYVRPAFRRQGFGKHLFNTIHRVSTEKGHSLRMWISFPDASSENLNAVRKITVPAALSIQTSGVRWAPLVAAPIWERRKGPIPTFDYPEKPPAAPSEIVKLAAEFLVATLSVPVGQFIYDAIRSWLAPKNEKRIRVKIGDIEVESNHLSVEEFRKLLLFVRDLKHEDEIRTKLLEAGYVIIRRQ